MRAYLKQVITLIIVCGYYFGNTQSLPTPVEQYGNLQVSGNKILSSVSGNPVQLRGMSMFWSQWGEGSKYYNTNIVNTLVNDWKANVVRAAMGTGVDAGGAGYINFPEREKNKVKTIVDACIANGVYVIIDWHSHVAHNELAAAKAFFAEMAQLYGQYPNVMYEIYNEPLQSSWGGIIKPYCEAVIDTIRAHDPDNLIICGTRNWSQEVEEVSTNMIDDVNVAYTLHFYAATHTENLRAKAQRAVNKGVPIFCTEFGTCEASGDGRVDLEETKKWWKFMSDNGISWCNWSIADKDEAASALKPAAPVNGNWTSANYTISGAFVRNELRYTYDIPMFDNSLAISTSLGSEVLQADSSYQLSFSLTNFDTLVADSLVNWKLEISNGGSITDSGFFVPNGTAGEYRLFATATYDTLITTAVFDFLVTDVKPGELTNDAEKTYLALSLNNEYRLATSIVYPATITTTIPLEGDSVQIGGNTYEWQIVTEPSGVFAQADSAVKTYLAIYVINPAYRLAQVVKTANGNSKIYVNGKQINTAAFELLKGENIFVIEYTGTVDTSFFDFTINTTNGTPMPYLTYSASSTGFFDCTATWNGLATINPECGCIGGTSGRAQCPGPFGGTPALIPGRIEAEEYDFGGANLTYFDATPGNNGNFEGRNPDDVDISGTGPDASIGWIDNNEWLKYTVNVVTAGKYVVDLRIASGRETSWGINSSIHLRTDNVNLLPSPIPIPITGGWNTWQTATSDTFSLRAGEQEITLFVVAGSFNINYMDFRLVEPVGLADDLSMDVMLFPNPYSQNINLVVEQGTEYVIYNSLGEMVEKGACAGECRLGESLEKGLYLIELIQNGKRQSERLLKQ